MHAFSSLIGICFAAMAILVIVRVIDLKTIARMVQRGLKAILAFVVLGMLVRMLVPDAVTGTFLGMIGSSLFLGMAFVVLALALVLIAKLKSPSGSNRAK